MRKYSTIFRKFLVSYLIILIIPSIAGFVSYRTSIAVTESISIENGVTQLQRAQELLERRMAEVEGFTRQLALNPDLNSLMNEKRPEGRTNLYGVWSLSRQVMPFSQTNDFLQTYFIYLKNYDVILSQGYVYFRPEHYYRSFRYEDMTLEEWRATMLERTHRSEIKPLSTFIHNNKQTAVVTYMQSLPLDSFSGSSPAAVVVMIDAEHLKSLLSGLEERYGGWTYISDARGNTISLQGIGEAEAQSLAMDQRFDPTKTSQFYNDDLVISIYSEKNGWIYRAGIPRHILMENANHIKQITWLVTGAALLAGLIVGLLLAYRNSAPINRLIAVVKEHFGKEDLAGHNEFDFLQGNISHMITNNRQLEQEVSRQLPLVRDGFLKRLIAGEFQTGAEIGAAAAQAGATFPTSRGYVGILQLHGYSGMDSVDILNELYAARLIVKRMLTDRAERLHMTDLGSDRIVAIFMASEETPDVAEERDAIQQIMEKVIQAAYKEYKMTLTAAFGEPFGSIPEVSESYEQAKQVTDYAEYNSKQSVVWFEDVRRETATYYYPIDMEQRLMSTIRAGDQEEAGRMVLAIMDKNTANQQLSIEMKQQLVGELKGTLLKLLDQKVFAESEQSRALRQQIIEIQATDGMAIIHNDLLTVAQALCGIVNSKKNDSHLQMIDDMKQFIAEYYTDAELTLYRIAERVERPEKYISQLFKEVTGINISDYLEKVRMEHATALLRSNSYTVDEIAVRVGYNSAHSFRRAFKRVMGVAPSAYRQTAQI